MNCENNFCIYCDSDICKLESISINGWGMCDDCIMVSIEEETLQKHKKKQICRYNQEYKF